MRGDTSTLKERFVAFQRKFQCSYVKEIDKWNDTVESDYIESNHYLLSFVACPIEDYDLTLLAPISHSECSL